MTRTGHSTATLTGTPADGTSTRGDGGRLLRAALRIDALASGATGVLLLAGGTVLDDILGAPVSLLWPVGLFLVGYAAALAFLAARPRINRAAAWAVIALNFVWVIESIALVVTGWASLTALGTAFVLAQAAVVALVADVQILGVRRAK